MPADRRASGRLRAIHRDRSAGFDNGPDIRPYAELVQRLEPALRGPSFAGGWQPFENSLGLERIPEPVRSLVLGTHDVKQDVVVGYWEMVLSTDPDELQAWIDTVLAKLDAPFLVVLGRPADHRRGAGAIRATAGRATRGMDRRRPFPLTAATRES